MDESVARLREALAEKEAELERLRARLTETEQALERTESSHRRGEEMLAQHSDLLEQTQVQLRRNTLFLESIIEHLPDMVFVKDAAELRFVRFNRAGEELLGYSREELIGKNDYDFFPTDEADFFTAKDREVLRRDTHEDIPEEPIHTRHQGLRWLHTKKIPIRDETGHPLYLLGISEDVTDRKDAAAELANRTRELERSNAELEQFAYIASHDLQEPLRMVASYVQLLERRYDDMLDDDAREFIEFAVDGATRMQKLINDLLTYSQVRKKPRPLDLTDCGLAAAQAIQNLKVAIDEASAQIVCHPLPPLRADGGQIVQLFQNLLANAIKFRGPEPPRIDVSAHRVDGGWRFEIHDNGIGISPDFHQRIFGMFQRLHTRQRYPGNGLGLALCRKIVESHDGTIGLDSAEGRGATFHFVLPER